jgi:hypothetical protein
MRLIVRLTLNGFVDPSRLTTGADYHARDPGYPPHVPDSGARTLDVPAGDLTGRSGPAIEPG